MKMRIMASKAIARLSRAPVAFAVVLALYMGGCGSSEDQSAYPFRKTQPVNWTLSGIPHANAVEIFANFGVCTLRPPPRLIEPEILRHGSKVTINAFVSYPIQKPSDETRCVLDVLSGSARTVHLDWPVADLKLFDGFTSPPELEWPKPDGVRVGANRDGGL